MHVCESGACKRIWLCTSSCSSTFMMKEYKNRRKLKNKIQAFLGNKSGRARHMGYWCSILSSLQVCSLLYIDWLTNTSKDIMSIMFTSIRLLPHLLWHFRFKLCFCFGWLSSHLTKSAIAEYLHGTNSLFVNKYNLCWIYFILNENVRF